MEWTVGFVYVKESTIESQLDENAEPPVSDEEQSTESEEASGKHRVLQAKQSVQDGMFSHFWLSLPNVCFRTVHFSI